MFCRERLRRALLATSVKHDFVSFELKSRRREFPKVAWAPMYLEHTVANATAEVMMMCSTGSLVPRGLTRKFDGHEPPDVHQ